MVLFTRDLRIHDQPALAAAAADGAVVPLFVIDERLAAHSANRFAFLLESLADLADSLRELGAPLVLRRGDPAHEAVALARETEAEAIHLSADVSAYARRRETALGDSGVAVRTFLGVTAVPPGELAPAGADHYRVFTPYWRRWSAAKLRPLAETPRKLTGLDVDPGELSAPPAAPAKLPPAGERAALDRLGAFLDSGISGYAEHRHELAADATSRLSPYLRFGCLSPRYALSQLPPAGDGAREFARELCWRDFFAQLLWAHPRLRTTGLNDQGDWNQDHEGLERWRNGETGEPVVDAAMRQLRAEGWLPNRARLIAGGYLTKTLGIDWRAGEQHFFELLVDGDPANNAGNWQWVAGAGVDPRRRGFNARRQSRRFDPDGTYAARWS